MYAVPPPRGGPPTEKRNSPRGGKPEQPDRPIDGRRNFNQRHKAGGYDGKKDGKYDGKYAAEREPEPTKDPHVFGLGVYAENMESMPEVSEDLRFQVRDITARRVLLELGAKPEALREGCFEDDAFNVLHDLTGSDKKDLSAGIKKQMQYACLFQYDEKEAVEKRQNDPNRSEESSAGGSRSEQPNTQRTASNASRYGNYADQEKETEKYLLGKFECLAVPARADYDARFEPIITPAVSSSSPAPAPKSYGAHADPSKVAQSTPPPPDCDSGSGFSGWFWVLHEGAPNIGEKTEADDFADYAIIDVRQEPGGYDGQQRHGGWKDRSKMLRLNEDLYINSMFILWHLALLSTVSLGVEDVILFPFGMGAFIRHLGKNDESYSDNDLVRRLRRRIADQLMKAIVSIYGDDLKRRNEPPPGGAQAGTAPKAKAKAKAKAEEKNKRPLPLRLHLCLVCVNAESIENHNVFIEAAADMVQDHPGLAELLKFRRNVDVLQLAHELSLKSSQPLKVALLNGANRKLFGNHWFATGARSAIDENLHRRSASLTRAALLLNMGTQPKKRMKDDLRDNLRWLGGKAELISETLLAPVPALDSQSQKQRPNEGTNTSAKPGASTSTGGDGPCACCKRRAPQAFSTEVEGKIAGGDLHIGKMTIDEAKLKATQLPDCKGFCHQGPPVKNKQVTVVEIVFKGGDTVERGAEKWTSYLRVKPRAPSANLKAKAKAKATTAQRENGDQV